MNDCRRLEGDREPQQNPAYELCDKPARCKPGGFFLWVGVPPGSLLTCKHEGHVDRRRAAGGRELPAADASSDAAGEAGVALGIAAGGDVLHVARRRYGDGHVHARAGRSIVGAGLERRLPAAALHARLVASHGAFDGGAVERTSSSSRSFVGWPSLPGAQSAQVLHRFGGWLAGRPRRRARDLLALRWRRGRGRLDGWRGRSELRSSGACRSPPTSPWPSP